MGAGSPEDHRPARPRVVVRASFGRLWQQLKLVNDLGSLSVRGAQAVSARVAPTQDNDPLSLGADLTVDALPSQHAVLLWQIFHREVHTIQLAPGNVQVPCLGGAAGQANRVVFFQKLLSRIVHADVDPSAKLDALCFHQLDPALHHRLLQLEVGDAQHQQAADVVGALQHSDRMPGPVQLLCGGQP